MADDEQPERQEKPPGTSRRKSETRQRTETLFARVTPDEKSAIQARADRAGLASAAFLRAIALGEAGPRARRRPPVDHVVIRQLLGELNRVGNNINQIARSLNSGEDLNIPELREALAAYVKVADAIYVALNKEPPGDHQGRQPRSP